MDTKIRHCFSIGSNCVAAMTLKSAGLRSCSGPFDWVFADTWIVKDCLSDEFSVFLDRSQHIRVHSSKAGHKKYGEHFFEHHDVTQDHTYKHFQRCVDRFTLALRSPERKLFLLSAFGMPVASRREYIEFYEFLTERTSNFILVVILHVDGADADSDCDADDTPDYSHEGGLVIKTFTTKQGYNGHSMRDHEDHDALVNFLKFVGMYDLVSPGTDASDPKWL